MQYLLHTLFWISVTLLQESTVRAGEQVLTACPDWSDIDVSLCNDRPRALDLQTLGLGQECLNISLQLFYLSQRIMDIIERMQLMVSTQTDVPTLTVTPVPAPFTVLDPGPEFLDALTSVEGLVKQQLELALALQRKLEQLTDSTLTIGQHAFKKKKAADEEAARKKVEAEEAAKKKAEEDEPTRKKAREEDAARKKAEEDEAAKKKAEEGEPKRKKAEDSSDHQPNASVSTISQWVGTLLFASCVYLRVLQHDGIRCSLRRCCFGLRRSWRHLRTDDDTIFGSRGLMRHSCPITLDETHSLQRGTMASHLPPERTQETSEVEVPSTNYHGELRSEAEGSPQRSSIDLDAEFVIEMQQEYERTGIDVAKPMADRTPGAPDDPDASGAEQNAPEVPRS
jgi:hypothetical protein